MNNIAIVVVTYNRLNLLKEEIASLRNQSYVNFQIIVVNNGSTDETLTWLREQNDIITITQDNCGGAGGFYTGMKYAAENGYEYCWIMDDDVICDKNALSELVKAYDVKPNIGFVCSKVIGTNGCPMNTPVVDDRGTENGYAEYYDLIENGMIKVKRATFVSVFFSSKIIYEIGLPYKDYFIWGDDYEYTARISLKYASYIACRSVVTHKRSIQRTLSFAEETNEVRLKNYYYKFRNEGYNSIKYEHRNKYKVIFNLIKRSIKLFLKFKMKNAGILIKSSIALLSFNPSITYPNKNL